MTTTQKTLITILLFAGYVLALSADLTFAALITGVAGVLSLNQFTK